MKNEPPLFLGALDAGESAAFSGIFLASSFPCSQAESTPSPAPVTHSVETVEKVPSRKLIFGKWDKNIEKRLVFCVPNNILAIFEPVVGDFCEDFSSKEFFDSLVRRSNRKEVSALSAIGRHLMSRRKIDPIPILNQPHDSTFPTKLQNRHVTRFGNPATRLGARYAVSDTEGLRQTAVDLEHLRLITDGVPITDSMAHRIEDRVRREQVLLDHIVAAEGVPEKLKFLLEIDQLADIRKYLSQQLVSEYELFLLIHNCKQIGWSHRSKFPEYVPDHLLITEKDQSDLDRGELKPIARKFASTMEERRRIHVHLFEKDAMWHCFYFSYDDLQDGSASHWAHGPHLHFVNHLWPKYSSDKVWSLFDTRHTKISGAVHVRFKQFEYSSVETNPVDLAFSPHFGYQPMLIVLDTRARSNPNRDPIPTAQVATRGFWSFDISSRSD